MWALALIVANVVAIVFIGLTFIRYDTYLFRMAEIDPLPPFVDWTFHAHKYTPLFIFFSTPAILYAVTKQPSVAQRRLAITISVIGLIFLAAWFRLIWLGMGYMVKILS